MARRYTVKTSLTFTQEMQQTLEAVSERFNVSVAQIVRECIESDLSRLVDNYKEREQNRKPIAGLHLHDS